VEGAEPGTTVLGLLHPQPGPLEQLGHETPDIGVVVDHEHALGIHTFLILSGKRVPYQWGRQ
jgi:hypothetical protein